MFGVEVGIELTEAIEHFFPLLGRRDQVRDAEMVRAISLSKATARHRHNSRLVDHLHAVQKVWLFASGQRFLDELLREVNLWERVHGTLDLRTGHVVHRIECIREQLGAFCKALLVRSSFLYVLPNTLVGVMFSVWWVDHQLDGKLAQGVAAEFN